MKFIGHPTKFKYKLIWVALFSLACVSTLKAEEPEINKLAILNTTDKTELGLAQSLQEGLGKAAANTNLFQTYFADYYLTGFSEAEISTDFKKVGADLMSYVYLENTRLSIFFFDSSHPKEFIVSAQNFSTPAEGTVTGSEIQLAFKTAFQEVLSSYVAKEYQQLPGSSTDGNFLAAEEKEVTPQFAAADVKKLYRELSSLSNKPLYVGANVGMSRFETQSPTIGKAFASTVNIGGLLGYRLFSPLSIELGADIFTHFLLHTDLRAQIPIGQKYVAISVSAGAARFMTQPTENLGYAGSNTIAQGTMVYGPGLGFEIPLLGLNIRAEARYYSGPTSVFLGTYGIVYSL